jgi:hypothetical protein
VNAAWILGISKLLGYPLILLLHYFSPVTADNWEFTVHFLICTASLHLQYIITPLVKISLA